jgi:hypothetical protein
MHLLHIELLRHCIQEYEASKQPLTTRFERAESNNQKKSVNGDVLVKRTEDMFFHGFGLQWSPKQAEIFKALIDSCLPIFYGDDWDENANRVLKARGLTRLQQEILVVMARRNGKTMVVSGAAAAIWLCVPGVTIAVFSVGKRQAGMFMTAAVEKIEMAFKKGTHIKSTGFNKIHASQEIYNYTHPDGGKQFLGCYPGSVKVR